MAERRIGLYPGTFDPITLGHLDIIKRALRLVDTLVVGVAVNAGKGPLFDIEERVEQVRAETEALGDGRIEIKPFEGLLVEFARTNKAGLVFRGLRAVSDFDYEFQMSSMNAKLAPEIDTVCLMASDKYQFIASRLVKEIAALGGDVSDFVPPSITSRLKEKFQP